MPYCRKEKSKWAKLNNLQEVVPPLNSNPMKLRELNEFDQGGFTFALADIFEHSPWIPSETWIKKPFSSVDDLHEKLCETLATASSELKIKLIRAHPDLAGKLAMSGELTEFSSNEQQSAQLDKLTEEQFNRITELNNRYRETFGFPFIICVKEHTQASIFKHFEDRIRNDSDSELEAALFQIGRIAWHRLNDLID